MITCRELVEFLMTYLDGELPLSQRARIRLHLAFCADCRRYVASYETAVRLGKQALTPSEDPVPSDVPEELVRLILESRRAPGSGPADD